MRRLLALLLLLLPAAPVRAENFTWQIDTGYEYSRFSRRPQTSWRQEYMQLNRFLDARKTVIHGRIERYDQFTNIDTAYELGADHVFAPWMNGYIHATVSPEADFRPDLRISTGGEIRLDRNPQGPAWWLALALREDYYTNTAAFSANPALRFEPREGWAVTARLITVSPRGEKTLYGQEARCDGTVRDGFRFRLGYADAPETESGVTVNTKTIYGGIAADFTPAHTLNLNVARDDRENSYVRQVYSVGFSYRF